MWLIHDSTLDFASVNYQFVQPPAALLVHHHEAVEDEVLADVLVGGVDDCDIGKTCDPVLDVDLELFVQDILLERLDRVGGVVLLKMTNQS